MVLSGRITLSTEEWVISRSCHRGMFSRAARLLVLTRRANPHTCSQAMGFRLWGIAEEPFCPGEKYSSTSRMSVRWRLRISVANFSTELAIIARVVSSSAYRSRWMIWLEMGAGFNPSLRQTYSSTEGSTWAKLPTAPEIFP